MSHLGAYFWLRLKKATYELDGLFESSLLYHYHQHSPRQCDRSLPRQKAGLSRVLYHGIVVDQRNTLQPLEDLSGSVVVVHRWLFHCNLGTLVAYLSKIFLMWVLALKTNFSAQLGDSVSTAFE